MGGFGRPFLWVFMTDESKLIKAVAPEGNGWIILLKDGTVLEFDSCGCCDGTHLRINDGYWRSPNDD